MARPNKTKVDYFPHFSKSGRTIYILENKFGNDGYAFWFKLLEILCDTDDHVYDCGNASNWEFLLAKTRVQKDKAEAILTTLANLGKVDGKLWWEHRIIWVEHLVANLEDVYVRRHSDLPKKPVFGDKNATDKGLLEQKPDQDGISEDTNWQSKVKESKVEKSKGENGSAAPQRIADLWNELCPALPKVAKMNDSRRAKVKSRIAEWGDPEKAVATAEELFRRVAASEFLQGNNDRNWVCTFDWLFSNSTNWVKVLEGNYDNHRGAKKAACGANAPEGVQLGAGEFISQDGRRTFGSGKVSIPMDAAPRPSERHSWDAASKTWILQ